MILRLTILSAAFATFAFGFSELAQQGGRSVNAMEQAQNTGCFDRGMVCAPSLAD